MPATYDKIATTTLGSDQATVTFSSITSAYTDLVVVANCASTGSTGVSFFMQFNSDTGANYSCVDMRGNGTAANSSRYNNETGAYLASSIIVTNTVGNAFYVGNIMNYSNANTFKTMLSRNIIAASGTELVVNTWRDTTAINSITFRYTTGNVKTNSTITLYGILKA